MDSVYTFNENLDFLLDTDTVFSSFNEDINFLEIIPVSEISLKEIGKTLVEKLKLLWEKIKKVINNLIDIIARNFKGSKFYNYRKELYAKKYEKKLVDFCLANGDMKYELADGIMVIDPDKLKNISIYKSIESKLKDDKITASDTIIYDLFGNMLSLKNKNTSLEDLKGSAMLYFGIRDRKGIIRLENYLKYTSTSEKTFNDIQKILKDMDSNISKLFKDAIKKAEDLGKELSEKYKTDSIQKMGAKRATNLGLGMKATSIVIGEHIRGIKTYMSDYNKVDKAYYKYLDYLIEKYKDEFFKYNMANIKRDEKDRVFEVDKDRKIRAKKESADIISLWEQEIEENERRAEELQEATIYSF